MFSIWTRPNFSLFITNRTSVARVSVWTRARVAIVIIVVTCGSIMAKVSDQVAWQNFKGKGLENNYFHFSHLCRTLKIGRQFLNYLLNGGTEIFLNNEGIVPFRSKFPKNTKPNKIIVQITATSTNNTKLYVACRSALIDIPFFSQLPLSSNQLLGYL